METETPRCPHCNMTFATWSAAKQHVKYCRGSRRRKVNQLPEAKAKEATPRFSGSTSDVILPQLNAEFWHEGVSILGILKGFRETTFNRAGEKPRQGTAYRLALKEEIEVKGVRVDEVELAPLTGLVAAFQSLKTKGYKPQQGDLWRISCTGIKKAIREGFSDSPEFSVDVL